MAERTLACHGQASTHAGNMAAAAAEQHRSLWRKMRERMCTCGTLLVAVAIVGVSFVFLVITLCVFIKNTGVVLAVVLFGLSGLSLVIRRCLYGHFLGSTGERRRRDVHPLNRVNSYVEPLHTISSGDLNQAFDYPPEYNTALHTGSHLAGAYIINTLQGDQLPAELTSSGTSGATLVQVDNAQSGPGMLVIPACSVKLPSYSEIVQETSEITQGERL